MKPVNIYALTRAENIKNLAKLERQMSARGRLLTIKKWEIQSLSRLVDRLIDEDAEAYDLEFFYSFQIPKLGKEFDLLRIGSDTVINIELKSESVSDEKLIKQLKLNQYYLSTLGLTIRSFTYISSQDRLVRLSNSGHLKDTEFSRLCQELRQQKGIYTGNIEELFDESSFIISPVAEPDRFLEHEYFLTSQQRDIENRILRDIREGTHRMQGFTGLPGTGKTLLLYDIAMQLSSVKRVALIHLGNFSEGMKRLSDRLKRIDFYAPDEVNADILSGYSAVLIDEGHRMEDTLADIVENIGLPIVFSYDNEDALSDKEIDVGALKRLQAKEDFVGYRLTNRIRTKSELSIFIQALMHLTAKYHRRAYPSVEISYGKNMEEAGYFIENYIKKGYTYIRDRSISHMEFSNQDGNSYSVADVSEYASMEYESVLMIVDASFYYDEEGYLRSENRSVRTLFHGLNRAKDALALIIVDNEELMNRVLDILQ